MNFLADAEALRDKLTKIREEFHVIPEIGNHEYKTAELIERYLVARLEGKLPGKNSALRSDIDALPITEATGINFASRNPGFMHACGHDVHITGAIGAAFILKAHEKDLCGSVTFIFQPDEEGDGGAKRIINTGELENVDAIFGCHVDPALPAGHVGIRYGNFYAASAMFHITIIGKSAHGAQRDKGIDSIEVASQVVTKLLAMNKPEEVVTVGKFHAGSAGNILADKAELNGIMRTFGIDNRARMCNELESITQKICEQYGAKYECELNLNTPGIVNDNNAITSLVERSAREILPANNVHVIAKPLYISEDFGYYIMHRTGNFYHIGAGCEYPLHSDKFLPLPDAIITASALHSAVVYNFNKE